MDYTDLIFDRMDFGAIDGMSEGYGLKFSDLVMGLITDGIAGFDVSQILGYFRGIIFSELTQDVQIMKTVIVIALGFALMQKFLMISEKMYISNICFMMIYAVIAVLLASSFGIMRDVADGALSMSVGFMQTLVPVYCILMVFAAGSGTALGFYQIAFVTIYIIQWLFLKMLIPMIQMYMLVELTDHFAPQRRLKSLAELMSRAVNWCMKIALAAVFVLNAIQNLIAPVKDTLTEGGLIAAAKMLPGVGSVAEGVSELIAASGLLIKNCAGVAALIVMIAICAAPWLKIACMCVIYKLAASAVEPVADGRIVGCLNGMADAAGLLVKMLCYSQALFLVTIALAAASGRKL